MSYYDDAIACYMRSEYSDAIALLKKCDGQDDDVQSWFAEVYLRLEEYSKSVKIYEKLCKKLGNAFDEYASLGLCYYELEKPKKAVYNLWQAVILNHDDTVAHTNLGRALYDCYVIEDSNYAVNIAQEWYDKFPDNRDAQHMGCAVLGLPPPAIPNQEFVKDVFEDFADSFDKTLSDLDYQAPTIIADYINQSDKPIGAICDMGCGTGLCAVALSGHFMAIDGMDLSPAMLEKAKKRAIYRDLAHMDITNYLHDKQQYYDWLIAGDVMCYIGDMTDIFNKAKNALKDDGMMVITIESYDTESFDNNCDKNSIPPYILSPSGRYKHHLSGVEAIANHTGLQIYDRKNVVLRHEHGDEVEGVLLIIKKI